MDINAKRRRVVGRYLQSLGQKERQIKHNQDENSARSIQNSVRRKFFPRSPG